MKLNQLVYTGVAGAIFLLSIQPAVAEKGSEIIQLSDVELPKTSAKHLFAQDSQTPIQITGVQLNTTRGLEVILDTTNGQLLAPVSSVDGNILVIDIPNAVLALPDTNSVTTKDPAEGISEVTVTQLENKVRVRVTGVDNAPTAKVSSDESGLILSLDTASADIELTVTAQKRPEDARCTY